MPGEPGAERDWVLALVSWSAVSRHDTLRGIFKFFQYPRPVPPLPLGDFAATEYGMILERFVSDHPFGERPAL